MSKSNNQTGHGRGAIDHNAPLNAPKVTTGTGVIDKGRTSPKQPSVTDTSQTGSGRDNRRRT